VSPALEHAQSFGRLTRSLGFQPLSFDNLISKDNIDIKNPE
jgi:hypothetical protein